MHMAHKTAVASLIHYEKNTFKASVCQTKSAAPQMAATAGLLLVAKGQGLR